ncbi:SDR family NAD(P)-dependent oxidoreductase [Brevibacterium sp. SMBL_HHYL_HB1]|jgi:NAD(P)-dependent dehydrogenase (short-subunit alcohol dehydrogenase family)|uniref:SDR family NAD(P)-dependent oxidoreductase n=1 Tax=Brevibacterium sp. SMBL_HHYL_HB1 TaxID=2777556 RepID=UPI001BA824DC|nr:SDR family NAD(P)-dependent oxidoreductase [Brevibacterium sp. SMBL_HHYL_HB1]QUL79208.1 SDR family NAD(P)-dependent oxidoreductase [Brevibacterium sp. SMBL_HHYL_HB1]HJA61699.1 SDR family NAD(P)-dependent oxidoreductase [Candidatus Brevibacterium intestinavium]
MDLQNTVALVTGGASGLGRATTERLLAAGAQVVMVDLNAEAGQQAAAELGESAHFVTADVTNEEQVQAAVDTATGLGPLRVVVNCAGVATPGKLVSRKGPLPLETFQKVLGINIVGTVNVCRLAAAAMQDQEAVGEERGIIINTASVAAFDGQIGQIAYSASKGAVASVTLPMARELAASLIRVVTIAPGIFETPMMAGLPAEAQESLGKSVPHPARLGKPAEYAQLVESIVANPMLNGETIRLDGAIRMAPK